ncbi:MAG: hypothetical protein K0U86_12615 [Planctomycetes bacterium]|nr:hypothetical protein [Planctomycetota bacterium]MCH9725730.1 hypothetical protein [Planctomycetota bacterium]MCH9777785.1 hypothetical protein [Planctomycetota bacterium]MCH9792792.1 hypothetical protein [Planctomycetota bacterium]
MKTHLSSGVRQHGQSQKVRASRSGVSLILVMFALSMSLVLTYSFIQTQSVLTQISENGSRRDQAMNAARAGITDALNRLNSLDWTGINDQYQRTFQSDTEGESTYTISFNAPADSLSSALELEVHSLGAWVSAENNNMRSEYQITVKVRLVPRLAGRTILPGDSAAATDLVTNPGDFDLIRQYALFADEGNNSLVLDPCDRIDGNLWLYNDLVPYGDPYWNSGVRSTFLQDLGKRFVTFPPASTNLSDASIQYPHPLAGNITFYNSPSSDIQQDLADLKVNWSVTAEKLTIPGWDDSLFSSYQIYAGGPTYHAVSVNSSLSDVTLTPTKDNPLGIFYRNGSLSVYDNVIIQGTLVAKNKITFNGKGIHVTAFNWKGSGGEALIPGSHLWPRLPSIVAEDIRFDRETQTTIEGAAVCHDDVRGAGGSVSYPDVSQIQLSGTATATSIEQPYSTVTLREVLDLSSLSSDGNYAIWLETTGTGNTGSTGTWYPIVGVDNRNQQLTIRGEIDHASPTSYLIKRHKQALTQIRGPVCAHTIDFSRLNEWVLSSSLWNGLKDLWEVENEIRTLSSELLIGFSEWLESPYNFPDWDTYYQLYGLNLEPTLHIQHLADQEYRWAPPLFQPYDGGVANAEQSGYRWSLIDWKESP